MLENVTWPTSVTYNIATETKNPAKMSGNADVNQQTKERPYLNDIIKWYAENMCVENNKMTFKHNH